MTLNCGPLEVIIKERRDFVIIRFGLLNYFYLGDFLFPSPLKSINRSSVEVCLYKY